MIIRLRHDSFIRIATPNYKYQYLHYIRILKKISIALHNLSDREEIKVNSCDQEIEEKK